MARGVVVKRKPWTKPLLAELRKHSKARTPVAKIARQMKRTVGALRTAGIEAGHWAGASAIVALRAQPVVLGTAVPSAPRPVMLKSKQLLAGDVIADGAKTQPWF